MDVVTLSRWQFAITCMFHFIFVPLTLGLSILTAYFETRWVLTNDETWLRMTKFWGKLFLINFALGVVTGITMEFQFGMNWAEYSRYVGDIFGAPLAIEATVAFFLESVFIGVWIFGWDRISKKAHALSIWLVALGTNLSALWILLANGWMQHPVGYHLVTDAMGQIRAEMIDFGALLTNANGWYQVLPHGHVGLCRGGLLRHGHLGMAPAPEEQPGFLQALFQGGCPVRAWPPRLPSPQQATSAPSTWRSTSPRNSPPWNRCGKRGRESISISCSFPTATPSATASRRSASRRW